jgi:hypothetical protein
MGSPDRKFHALHDSFRFRLARPRGGSTMASSSDMELGGASDGASTGEMARGESEEILQR